MKIGRCSRCHGKAPARRTVCRHCSRAERMLDEIGRSAEPADDWQSIIGTNWATSTKPIVANLREVAKRMLELTGYAPVSITTSSGTYAIPLANRPKNP